MCSLVLASESAVTPIEPIRAASRVEVQAIDASSAEDQSECDLKVILDIVLNRDGTVKSANVVESNATQADENMALKIIHSWRFKPKRDGIGSESIGQFIYYPKDVCAPTLIFSPGHSHNKAFKHAPSARDAVAQRPLT